MLYTILYIIIHTLLYYTILLYIIYYTLSYTILFSSSVYTLLFHLLFLYSILSFSSSQSSNPPLLFILLDPLSISYYTLLFPPLHPHPLQSPLIYSPNSPLPLLSSIFSPHPKYILSYILYLSGVTYTYLYSISIPNI